jgi:hypothetical protein
MSPHDAALSLLEYCRANDWAGYDPYDAINSRLFEIVPFLDSRLPRLVLTQALKRSPINLRPALLVPKTRNPKGLGLFLAAVVRLDRSGLLNDNSLVGTLIDLLKGARSQNARYSCWGYSFAWQTRTIVVPRGTPNLVCTTFVADALLDAYEHCGEQELLTMAFSAAEYIANELFWTEGNSIASLSYPMPRERSRVHNANFLGAALLCRVSRLTGEKKFLEPALKVARYSAGCQHSDGSWPYGERANQAWIDNFHTGFNLCALRALGSSLESDEFEPHIRRGFAFYFEHFFLKDGTPKYFHDRTYPIDSHCVSQSIITLLQLKELAPGSSELAQSVFRWAISNLWDSSGYFYYRKLPFCTIRTSYMRWVQAWMLLALATLCEEAALTNGKAAVSAAQGRR